MSVAIRRARPDEAGLVLALVRELAEYEKLLHEVEATEAGTVRVPLGGITTSLRVRRIPGDADESDLEIYFRDATSGRGSYPAGRFVSLTPLPDGRYRLDLNRARNPFCAYSSVYACPVPWPGNSLPGEARAGERYDSSKR